MNILYLIQSTDCPNPLSIKKSECGLAVFLILLSFRLVVAINHPFSPLLNSTSSFQEDNQNSPSPSQSQSEYSHHRFLLLLPIFTIKIIDKAVHTYIIIILYIYNAMIKTIMMQSEDFNLNSSNSPLL